MCSNDLFEREAQLGRSAVRSTGERCAKLHFGAAFFCIKMSEANAKKRRVKVSVLSALLGLFLYLSNFLLYIFAS